MVAHTGVPRGVDDLGGEPIVPGGLAGQGQGQGPDQGDGDRVVHGNPPQPATSRSLTSGEGASRADC